MEKVTIRMNAIHEFDTMEVPKDELKPKQLMLLSLGECSGLTALSLFEKMNIAIGSFEIENLGQLTEPAAMAYSRFTAFHQVYRIECPAQDAARASHAVSLVVNKYCGVGLMYSLIAPISVRIIVNGAEMPVEDLQV